MTRYALCRAADSFSIAGGGYDKTIKGIKPGPTLEKLPGFFGQPAQVEGCGKGDTPVVIDSMYSAWCVQHLQSRSPSHCLYCHEARDGPCSGLAKSRGVRAWQGAMDVLKLRVDVSERWRTEMSDGKPASLNWALSIPTLHVCMVPPDGLEVSLTMPSPDP